MVKVENLTPHHFVEWGAPFIPKDLLGYAIREGERLICLGGLWIIEGRAWATFDANATPPRLVHRLALNLIKEAKRADIPALWAELDEGKPNARKWLERCGFEYVSHNDNGIPVWRLELDGRSSDNDLDGCVNRNERDKQASAGRVC